jgi:hypothetical protein
VIIGLHCHNAQVIIIGRRSARSQYLLEYLTRTRRWAYVGESRDAVSLAVMAHVLIMNISLSVIS